MNTKNNIHKDVLISELGQREMQIFEMLSKGKKTSQIAMELSLKPNTISTIKKVIYRKLKVSSSLEFYKFVFHLNENQDNVQI